MGKPTISRLINRKGRTHFDAKQSMVLGFGISITGSLGVGVLNVAAVQLSALQGWFYALGFSTGCAMVEMVFVRYMADFTQYLSKREKARRIFEWGTLALLLLLGLLCFRASGGRVSQHDNLASMITYPAIFVGMFMRLINPSMVPFWIGWNAVLVGQKMQYKAVLFALGAGCGTLFMHSLYILSGQWAIEFFKENAVYFNWFLGFMFIFTAIVQGIGLIRRNRKSAAV